MTTSTSENNPSRQLRVWVLLTSLLVSLSAQAAVDRRSSIEASGEGSIYDVKATANGTLRVCTKPARVGDRWRATIVQVTTNGAVSAVGTGSTTSFSGCISRSITSGVQYMVLVTWDRPLPGTFPTTVTTRFTGPTDDVNPPVVQLDGRPLASIVPRPIRWTEPRPICPADGSLIGCEALVACEFNPAGDTDTLRVTVPANADLSINVAGPSGTKWMIFAPNGNPINPSGCFGLCEVALSTAGNYTIQTYNVFNSAGAYRLSLLGISTPFRCGPSAIPGGSPITGQFNRAGDTDSYQLNGVSAGQTYSINVIGPPGTMWKIFDLNGNPINPSGCSGLCQVVLPTAGGHTVKVYNVFNSTGSYTLSVQRVGG